MAQILVVDDVISMLTIDPAEQVNIDHEPVRLITILKRPDPGVIREKSSVQREIVKTLFYRSGHKVTPFWIM